MYNQTNSNNQRIGAEIQDARAKQAFDARPGEFLTGMRVDQDAKAPKEPSISDRAQALCNYIQELSDEQVLTRSKLFSEGHC